MDLSDETLKCICNQYPKIPLLGERYRCKKSDLVLDVHAIFALVKISMRHKVVGHQDGFELISFEHFSRDYEKIALNDAPTALDIALSKATPEEVQRIRALLR